MISKIRRNKRFPGLSFIVLLVVVMLLTTLLILPLSCGKKEAKEIKIGVILPLTGNTAWLGAMHRWGIELAVKEINAAGGVNGNEIHVFYEDDENNPSKAVSALRKLISTVHPQIVIIAMSQSAMATYPIAEEHELILFANCGHPEIVNKSEWVFRIFLTSGQEAKKMAILAHDFPDLQKVSVLYIRDSYGEGGKDVFVPAFEELGGEIPIVESYEKDGTDFRSEVSKAIKYAPDAVYVIGYGNATGKVLNQLRELGYKGKILGTSNFVGPPLTEIAVDPLENSLFTTPYFDPRLQDSTIQDFVFKIRREFEKTPQWNTVMEYDGFYIIYNALLHATSLSAQDLKEALFKVTTFSGVGGNYTYEDREWLPEVLVRTYKNHELKDFTAH